MRSGEAGELTLSELARQSALRKEGLAGSFLCGYVFVQWYYILVSFVLRRRIDGLEHLFLSD
jgi:hypothetical protein